MVPRHLPAIAVATMVVVAFAGVQSGLGAGDTDGWSSSLKTGDVVARGTLWKVTVTPTPDEVNFWASGRIIATDRSAPFETPLDLVAGDYKLGLCHRKDGVQECETTEPGTGIVARVKVVDPAPPPPAAAPTAPSSESGSTTSSPPSTQPAGSPPRTDAGWSSSLKSGDVVARGTLWQVTVTPTPDEVEFWASGRVIATDKSAPFETPLDLAAGDYKLGFCHRKDGVKKCETTEPGTGIVARVTVAVAVASPPPPPPPPPPPATDTSSQTPTTSSPTTSSPTTSPTPKSERSATSPKRTDSSAPRPVRRIDVTAANASTVKVQWPSSRDNVAVAGYGLFLNGRTAGTTPETRYTFGSLACGTGYIVGVDAYDAAGNHSGQTSTTVSTSACLDLVAPSPPTGVKLAAATESTVVLTWLPSSDNVGVIGYGLYVGGLRFGSTSEATATLANLECGRSYEIGIDAVDAAGNRSARASSYFSTAPCVDRQAPSTPGGLAASATTTSVTLSWSGSTDNVGVAGYGLYRGSSAVATTTQTTATFSDLACGTSYTLGVDAVDAAGNRSSVASMSTSTQPCPPPPTSVSWSSNLETGDVVERGTLWQVTVTPAPDDVEFWASGRVIATDSSAPFETPLDLAAGDYKLGLCHRKDGVKTCETTEPGTGIVARVTVVDPSPPATGADTTPPTQPGSLRVVSAGATSVSVAWSASTDNTGVAGYGLYRGSSPAGTTTQTSASFSGLTCGTAYLVGVDAYDAAGNRSSRADITITTSACTDTQAPTVPTNVATGTRTATSIALSWSASTDNVGVVGYGLYQGGSRVSTTPGTTGIVSGLSCGTNYTLGVDAYDAAGNRSSQAVVMVSTTACADTQSPTAPTGLKASNVTQTSLGVAWSASTDNVGVTGYDVYRNGTKVGSTTSLTYSLASLVCNTAYTVGVVAFDAAGNRSPQAQLVATTTACSVAPTSGAVSMSPAGNDSTCSRGGPPCLTWARAYAIAQSGDRIMVAGGTYGGIEQLAGTKQVTFQVSGGTATVNGPLRFMNIENLTLRGPIKINVDYQNTYSLRLQGCNRNVEFYDVSGTHFSVGGSADHIWFYGGEWGNYTERPFSSDSTVSGYYGKTYLDSRAGCSGLSWNADGILRDIGFDGVTWQNCDYTADQGGGHPDCIESSGGTDGVTIRNSVFRRCGDTCIGWFTDWWHNYNFRVENTLFQYAYETHYGIQAGDKDVLGFAAAGMPAHCRGFVFRNNTYDMDDPNHDSALNDDAPLLFGCDLDTAQVYGNIFGMGPGSSNCPGWSYNVFEKGNPCGTSYVVGDAGFVNRGTDYHLTSTSRAIGKGNPSAFPSTDADGDPRSTPPEAGFDER